MEARGGHRLDRIFRDFTVGLTEELRDHFVSRFDEIRRLNYEQCPGEYRCSTKESGKIYKILKGSPESEIRQICAGCDLRKTKPENAPEHLQEAIAIASELDADSLICGGFDYPAILEYLDPMEWACLSAIKDARQISENKAVSKPAPQQGEGKPSPQHVDHLKRLAHGGRSNRS